MSLPSVQVPWEPLHPWLHVRHPSGWAGTGGSNRHPHPLSGLSTTEVIHLFLRAPPGHQKDSSPGCTQGLRLMESPAQHMIPRWWRQNVTNLHSDMTHITSSTACRQPGWVPCCATSPATHRSWWCNPAVPRAESWAYLIAICDRRGTPSPQRGGTSARILNCQMGGVDPQHWWFELGAFSLPCTIQSPGCCMAEEMSLSPPLSISRHRGTLNM